MGDKAQSLALSELVQRNWLSENYAQELVERSLRGEHALFVGPSREGKLKLAQALARDVGQIARVWTAEEAENFAAAKAASHQACLAGADFIFFPRIQPQCLFELMMSDPSLVVIASLPVASPNALWLYLCRGQSDFGIAPSRDGLNFLQKTLGKSVCTVGFDLQKHPRVATSAIAMPKPSPTIETSSLPHLPRGWELETQIHDPGWELDGDGLQGPIFKGEEI